MVSACLAVTGASLRGGAVIASEARQRRGNPEAKDRVENIQRIGEMSKLFMEAGVIVLAAFISSFRADHERICGMARVKFQRGAQFG